MKILVTGGLGYIGSHTCVELLMAGHDVVVVDNLLNSLASVFPRICQITGKVFEWYEVDARDRTAMEMVFTQHLIDGVIHFAGLKAVGESVIKPLYYYNYNIISSIILFETMEKFGVKKLVFSSSATVYGIPTAVPILESFPLSATSPYGRSKLMIEEILEDIALSDPTWRIAILRYFNPVGAHESGLIGEAPNGIPNNLLPYIAQVAEGQRELLSIYGNDYPTMDGTGIRDYIHVVDLAIGHVKTLDKLAIRPGVIIYNLGSGRGNSVLEMVHEFEKASGRVVPYQIVARRQGDIACYYANAGLAERELGWKAERTIEQICIDAWRWQTYAKHTL